MIETLYQNNSVAYIIYHRVDLDGIASAAIAFNYCREMDFGTIFKIGWNYGDPIPEIPLIEGNLKEKYSHKIYVLDISFGEHHKEILNKWIEAGYSVVWMDHHKTAIDDEVLESKTYHGIRRVGTAACALAWEYFLS